MFRATMLVEWNGRKKTGGKSDEKRKTDIFGVKEKKRIEDFYFVSRKKESRSNERRKGGGGGGGVGPRKICFLSVLSEPCGKKLVPRLDRQ